MGLFDYAKRAWQENVTKLGPTEFNRMEAGIAAALGIDYVTGVSTLSYDPNTTVNPGTALATFGDANVAVNDQVLLTNGPHTGIWIWKGQGVAMQQVRSAAAMPRGHHVTHIPNSTTTPLGLWAIYAAASAVMVAGIEPWRVIGAAGQPAFANSFANYNPGTTDAAFRKTAQNEVKLRGMIKTGASSATAFTLPAGYRPIRQQNVGTVANAGIGYITIDTTGAVKPLGAGVPTWVSLDDVSFFTD